MEERGKKEQFLLVSPCQRGGFGSGGKRRRRRRRRRSAIIPEREREKGVGREKWQPISTQTRMGCEGGKKETLLLLPLPVIHFCPLSCVLPIRERERDQKIPGGRGMKLHPFPDYDPYFPVVFAPKKRGGGKKEEKNVMTGVAICRGDLRPSLLAGVGSNKLYPVCPLSPPICDAFSPYDWKRRFKMENSGLLRPRRSTDVRRKSSHFLKKPLFTLKEIGFPPLFFFGQMWGSDVRYGIFFRGEEPGGGASERQKYGPKPIS